MAVPLRAAPPPVSAPLAVKATVAGNPAALCRNDVQTFNAKIEKEGYWLGGSDYGYGYPMGGIGYGDGYGTIGYAPGNPPGFQDARPGYEIRILLASANIMAANGQQQGCEDILETTKGIYEAHLSEVHRDGSRFADRSGWQLKELAAAHPVTADHTSFRSDELIDTAVRDTRDQALGSVQDLVTDPKTGKVAYLVIARGGIFGIDQKYVPVPWDDFKVTADMKLLVLDTTKAAMDTAPEVTHNEILTPTQFDKRSQEVDAYWKIHLAN
jgi:sporulation protein YlmC with PRC-barrel domain